MIKYVDKTVYFDEEAHMLQHIDSLKGMRRFELLEKGFRTSYWYCRYKIDFRIMQ